MSWGGPYLDPTITTLINLSSSQITWVGAAGNSSNDMNNPKYLIYPGALNRVIGVGSTDKWDRRSIFSNFGDSVDIMAPGSGIYSLTARTNSSYATHSGTSMATPLVASVAALIKAYHPTYT